MSEAAVKKICPVCNCELVCKETAYPMGSALMSRRFHVDIYSCPECSRVSLFASDENEVTCPVCGTTHPAKEKCAICALNSAFEGRD